VSWRFKPVRQKGDMVRVFKIIYSSDNADQLSCTQEAIIKGAPKDALVRLPQDPVGRYGDKIAVPVIIDPTIGKDVYVYKLNVEFDPQAVRFVDAVSLNTLTGRGWSGPRWSLHTRLGAQEETIVRVEDYTTGSPLNTKQDGILVVLMFEAVYGGGDKDLSVMASDLKFVRSFDTMDKTTGNPVQLYSSLNSPEDNTEGTDVNVTYMDGRITVSGDCIVPLVSNYDLSQNVPNPFNPSTVIEYALGEETDVTLKVYDALGRDVRTLVSAHQKAGVYKVTFDAGDLASGTYLYRLETPNYSKNLRMILAR